MADVELLLEEIQYHLLDAIQLCTSEPIDSPAVLAAQAQLVFNTAGALLRQVAVETAATGQWSLDGFRSPGAWLAHVAGSAPPAAKRVVREGRLLADMPATRAAAAAGTLDDARIAQLTRCRSRAPEHYSPELDAAMVGVALQGSWHDFLDAARAFHLGADAEEHPDDVDDLGQPVPEPSTFHLSETLDGRWHATMDLSADDGTILQRALGKYVGKYLQAKRDGDPSLQNSDMAAIRAQALMDLADQSMRREPGERSTPNRYGIALTLYAKSQAGGTTDWVRDGHFPPGATCDATFYRLVLGARSEILDVGRATRSWDGAIGNAIRQRDGTCRFPGCDQPPHRCDIHHCTPWEAGGDTSVANGVLLCRFHHTFIHANHWHVTLDRHQQPVFAKPDGTDHPQAARRGEGGRRP